MPAAKEKEKKWLVILKVLDTEVNQFESVAATQAFMIKCNFFQGMWVQQINNWAILSTAEPIKKNANASENMPHSFSIFDITQSVQGY